MSKKNCVISQLIVKVDFMDVLNRYSQLGRVLKRHSKKKKTLSAMQPFRK